MVRDLVNVCWPLVFALLAQQWVWNGALISAAKHQSSADFDGIAIGYRCYAVGVALFAAYAAYLLPRSARRMAESKNAFHAWIRRSHRDAAVVTILIVLGAPLAAWVLVPMAFGHRYNGAPLASCLYILALIPLLWRITSSNAIVALGKTKAYCAVSLVGAATALLVVVLTPSQITTTPIFASAAGETVFAIGSYWTLSRLIAKS
jgi:O-antigen/teichoic acid export membrane protein